jgi:hypothetical protein
MPAWNAHDAWSQAAVKHQFDIPITRNIDDEKITLLICSIANIKHRKRRR